MKYFFYAAIFVLKSRFENRDINCVRVSFKMRNETLDALTYYPRNFGKKNKKHNAILAIHGMSALGNEDPRMDSICRALASCGYFVVSPFYRDIAEFTISYSTVENIMETIKVVANDKNISPDGKISIFSASFSAGMSIIASSQQETAELVRAICSVGTYCRALQAIEHMIIRQDTDEYGRLIILKNFISNLPGFDEKAVIALHEAILDNGLKREHPKFPEHLSGLDGILRENVIRILSDPDYRRWHWTQFISRSKNVEEMMGKLSVIDHVEGLSAKVVFIHGEGDTVIPPSESEELHHQLKKRRIPTRLLITPLISHGDVTMGLSMAGPIADLVRVFAFFFKHASSARSA
jgi:acetyl esterase/lipase